MSEDERILKQAMLRIEELVDEVIETCHEVADENHFERVWVLERFRAQFNKTKRAVE